MFWLTDDEGNLAPPSLWTSDKDIKEESLEEKGKCISSFANSMIQGSLKFASCKTHLQVEKNCPDCQEVHKLVSQFQSHSHKKSCYKKKQVVRISGYEGHGRHDGKKTGEPLLLLRCRYDFPKNPSNKSCFITAFPRDHPKQEVNKAKEDFVKVRKYLLRLTNTPDYKTSTEWREFQSMSFAQFLFAVGMYEDNAVFEDEDEESFKKAQERYFTALRCDVKSTGYILLERSCADVFINNFNKNIILMHPANHDLQFVTDPYAVVQYIVGKSNIS